MLPRQVPSKDEFYIGMAFWAASKSKDPSTQCGAFIISEHNEPLGWGYNGPPKNIDDYEINWQRPEKYDYVNHAEVNAIHHAKGSTKRATIYVTAKPCKFCMLDIVRAEISNVVYFPYVPKDSDSMLSDLKMAEKTEEIARLGKVHIRIFDGNLNWMLERMESLKKIGVL